MLAPRALIGHSASTRPLRTPTYQSCKLTVGSQCPGMSQTFSPSDRGLACGPTLSFTVLIRDAGHFDVGAIMHPRGAALGAVGLEACIHDDSVGRRHADN